MDYQLKKYTYYTSLSAPMLYPAVFLIYNIRYADGSQQKLRFGQSLKGEWGDIQPFVVIDGSTYQMPNWVDLDWLSIAENKRYKLSMPLDVNFLETLWDNTSQDGEPLYSHISVSVAPNGGVAFWFFGRQKQKLVKWMEASLSSDKDTPMGLPVEELYQLTIKDMAEDYLSKMKQHGLPDPHLFDRMMQQYTYRFLPVLKKWDDDNHLWINYEEDEKQPELDYVEVKCHDGTFDRLRDGSLLNYYEAGKPSRVCVGWHVGKREYSAYFFFSHDELAQVFRNCYGAHPDTKVDFFLQIDPESDKYEPALFRYGLKEPLAIGPDACQVLAFRNKFECYRSPNYSQPKGAWR